MNNILGLFLVFSDDPDDPKKVELRESLQHGVDILSFSQKITRKNAIKWRQPLRGPPIYLYTQPVRNKTYTRLRLGRRDYSDPKNCDENSVIGYYPVVRQKKLSEERDYFYLPTSGRNLKFAHVFASQFLDWCKNNVIRPVHAIGPDTRLKDHADVFLQQQMEDQKPRACFDGSSGSETGPRGQIKEALPCILDDNRQVVEQLEENDQLGVVDDSSGFNQALLSPYSQRFASFIFGAYIFALRALPFGLVASPSKFQALNRVAVLALQRELIKVFLYLDDRLVVSKLGRPLRDGETSVELYMLFCLLVAFGGYVSMKKSSFIPGPRATFLGLNYDTEAKTVSVPTEKYQKACRQIDEFLAGKIVHGQKMYDMKLLEKLRGRIVSWFVVVQNYSYYLKEANEALKIWEALKASSEIGSSDILLHPKYIPNLAELRAELGHWILLDRVQLPRQWQGGSLHNHLKLGKYDLHTDASGGGLGSCLVQSLNGQAMETRNFALPLELAGAPIHAKEAAILILALLSYGNQLDDSYVTIWCDNWAVVQSWHHSGGKNVDISRHLRALVEHCEDHRIKLNLEWVSTHEQLADEPSRTYSLANCRLRPEISEILVLELRLNMDLFADPTNFLPGCEYFSRYPFPGSSGEDALTLLNRPEEKLLDHHFYAFPPKKLARPFLSQIYPKLDFVAYVHHHNFSEGDLEPFLMSYSHYRVLIGCSKGPACLAPSGCRRTDSGVPYYRLHKTGLTYLYCRGYSLCSLRRFSESLQRLPGEFFPKVVRSFLLLSLKTFHMVRSNTRPNQYGLLLSLKTLIWFVPTFVRTNMA